MKPIPLLVAEMTATGRISATEHDRLVRLLQRQENPETAAQNFAENLQQDFDVESMLQDLEIRAIARERSIDYSEALNIFTYDASTTTDNEASDSVHERIQAHIRQHPEMTYSEAMNALDIIL